MGKNDITGDTLVSKVQNKAYDDGYDRIFGKNKAKELEDKEKAPIKEPDKTKSTLLSSS